MKNVHDAFMQSHWSPSKYPSAIQRSKSDEHSAKMKSICLNGFASMEKSVENMANENPQQQEKIRANMLDGWNA